METGLRRIINILVVYYTILLIALYYRIDTVYSEYIQYILNIHSIICLGEQSIKDDNVLSEKINFSAPGGPKSTIFYTDDVDPLYFEISIVLAPPDPRICLKMPKCAIFITF